jgi:hypothetical protein
MPTGPAVIMSKSSGVVLDTGQHYFVKNNTNQRLTLPDGRTDFLRWARVAYRCEAQEETIVPWAVIALYFGDPRSQDKIIKAEDSQGEHIVPTRTAELLRLSVFYGVYEQAVDIIANMVPDVTIRTLSGVEVIPPVFDPYGEHVYGFQRSINKSQDIATMMGELQEQMDELRSRYDTIIVNGDNDGAIPVDNPQGMPL